MEVLSYRPEPAELYGGMHDRLRQLGRDHLASGGTGRR